jgi:hypothetical protein
MVVEYLKTAGLLYRTVYRKGNATGRMLSCTGIADTCTGTIFLLSDVRPLIPVPVPYRIRISGSVPVPAYAGIGIKNMVS